jgi:Uma2 family endonuclease
MTTTPKLMTAEELFEMPEDDFRYELLDGVLIKMSPANEDHSEVMGNVTVIFRAYRSNHPGVRVLPGDPGIVLRRRPDRVRAPDLAYFAPGRLPRRAEPARGFIEIMPDLVVEIVSPTDRAGEVRRKIAEWLDAGVRAVWALYPERHVLVVHPPDTPPRTYAEDETVEGGSVMPGFVCKVAEFFV